MDIHTDHVGSLLRPRALLHAREAFADGSIGSPELKAAEDRAIDHVVTLKEQAGQAASARRSLVTATTSGSAGAHRSHLWFRIAALRTPVRPGGLGPHPFVRSKARTSLVHPPHRDHERASPRHIPRDAALSYDLRQLMSPSLGAARKSGPFPADLVRRIQRDVRAGLRAVLKERRRTATRVGLSSWHRSADALECARQQEGGVYGPVIGGRIHRDHSRYRLPHPQGRCRFASVQGMPDAVHRGQTPGVLHDDMLANVPRPEEAGASNREDTARAIVMDVDRQRRRSTARRTPRTHHAIHRQPVNRVRV